MAAQARLQRTLAELWRAASRAAPRVAAPERPTAAGFGLRRRQPPWRAGELPECIDEWVSLQDLQGSHALRMLKAEADATEAIFKGTQEAAFEEQLQYEAATMLEAEGDATGEAHGPFRYFQRTSPEGFVVYCRERLVGGPVEIVLDAGQLARDAGSVVADVVHCKVSDDHQVLAYIVDLIGDESFELRFRDLNGSTTDWPSPLLGVRSFEFSGGGDAVGGFSILAVHADPQTKRASRILRWRVSRGMQPEGGEVLWKEPDEAAYLELFRTKDRRFVLLSSNTKDTAEVRVLCCNDHSLPPKALLSRREGVEYFAEHRDGSFYVISNHERPDFAVYRLCDESSGSWDSLESFFFPPGSFHITDADALAGWLVLYGHEDAGPAVRVVQLSNRSGEVGDIPSSYAVKLPSAVGCVEPGTNAEAESSSIRITFRSPVEPGATYELDLASGKLKLLSRRHWTGGSAAADEFACDRIDYPARDGELVPLTLLRARRDTSGSSPRACLLHVYGAYGSCLETDFRPEHIALVRRGWAIAWAHVRGGGERGRRWHNAARRLDKARSVLDLADAVRFLLARGIAQPGTLCAKASSAGGLTLGALLNSAEFARLLGAAVLEVPFVDALTGMLDTSLPLTVHEFSEWGDPRDPDHADNLWSLSPYENIGQHRYPPLYVSCAMEDTRVPAWMALKYVSRLRTRGADFARVLERHSARSAARRSTALASKSSEETDRSTESIVLHVSEGGHGGASDWHGRSQEFSRQIAFLHRALGIPLA